MASSETGISVSAEALRRDAVRRTGVGVGVGVSSVKVIQEFGWKSGKLRRELRCAPRGHFEHSPEAP